MTIKIIGIDEKETHQISCKNCASRLEYVLADSWPSGNNHLYITCPKCKKAVLLQADN